MNLYSFEKLDAYQMSRHLVVEVYKIIDQLPNKERSALALQLQRAIISVASNIAEGSGRISVKEKIHFLEISYGSLMETYCQLQLCRDLNYISDDTLNIIKPDFFRASRLINSLRTSFVNKITP